MDYKVYSRRWVNVGIFWFVLFSFGTNWFALSPMLGTLKTTYMVSTWEAHLLISIIGMFVIFFAWPAGALIDKKGPKLSTSVGAAFMMIGFGIRPWMLDTYGSMIISSVIAGLGLAWILVAMAPQTLRWFPQKQAGLPIGITASGLFIGFGTGSLLMPLLVEAFSVFTAFLFFGVFTVFAFLLWIMFGRDSPPTPPEERPEVKSMKFSVGMKQILQSRNAYFYPMIGFLIVGITLVISAFIHSLYPGREGGYISGFLLYGCALGAFAAPYAAKKYGLRKIALGVVLGAVVLWILLFSLYEPFSTENIFIIVATAFVFGICLQASWPLGLFYQETEKGVTEANIGIAASLYISLSNIGAAVLPEVFAFIFNDTILTFTAILISLILGIIIWSVVKKN